MSSSENAQKIRNSEARYIPGVWQEQIPDPVQCEAIRLEDESVRLGGVPGADVCLLPSVSPRENKTGILASASTSMHSG